MTISKLLGATALQTGVLVLVTSATPAFAQTTTTTTTTTAAPTAVTNTDASAQATDTAAAEDVAAQAAARPAPGSDVQIVVTGSRIRRPNLESPVPITSVAAQDLTSRG